MRIPHFRRHHHQPQDIINHHPVTQLMRGRGPSDKEWSTAKDICLSGWLTIQLNRMQCRGLGLKKELQRRRGKGEHERKDDLSPSTSHSFPGNQPASQREGFRPANGLWMSRGDRDRNIFVQIVTFIGKYIKSKQLQRERSHIRKARAIWQNEKKFCKLLIWIPKFTNIISSCFMEQKTKKPDSQTNKSNDFFFST